jgi:MFS family permease
VARSSAGFGLALLLFAASPTIVWAFPLGFLVGAASIAFLTSSTAIVQVQAAPQMRGRVLALQAIVFLGSTPIGGPILGAICELTNPRVGVVVGGLAACGAAAWGFAMDRRRPRPSAPVEAEADVVLPEPA